ncbi:MULTISPECIES: LutC/YkgG family protein [unclassified Micromonospora]|uniref:LutC/YkgG family protein n=1 Tax=unclassified Micromonospora TaxID=2617518 RepID=UPI0033D351FA
MVGRSVTSRDLVLGRLRAALAGSPADPVPVPRDYRRAADADLDQLAQRLTDYRAHVHRIPEAAVADTIADILPAGGTVVVPPGLAPAWLPATVTALPDDGLDHARIGAADGVVTAAAVAIAETGTVVLDGSPDQGRRVLSLLPDLHICVVRADQVVATVPEALARLTPQRPLTWISGPSATSDIELIRVEGVHGPRRLHVLLLP